MCFTWKAEKKEQRLPKSEGPTTGPQQTGSQTFMGDSCLTVNKEAAEFWTRKEAHSSFRLGKEHELDTMPHGVSPMLGVIYNRKYIFGLFSFLWCRVPKTI